MEKRPSVLPAEAVVIIFYGRTLKSHIFVGGAQKNPDTKEKKLL
jgi:hypothetical protein